MKRDEAGCEHRITVRSLAIMKLDASMLGYDSFGEKSRLVRTEKVSLPVAPWW